MSEGAIRKQRSRDTYLMENIKVILTCRGGKNLYEIFILNPSGKRLQ